jgi:hypothetical protein
MTRDQNVSAELEMSCVCIRAACRRVSFRLPAKQMAKRHGSNLQMLSKTPLTVPEYFGRRAVSLANASIMRA